jgi:hypothetical protein
MGCLSTLSRFDLHKYEKILSTYVLLSQPASLLNLLIASDFVTETQYVGQCNTLSCTLYSLSGVDEFNGDVMFAGQYHTCCGRLWNCFSVTAIVFKPLWAVPTVCKGH